MIATEFDAVAAGLANGKPLAEIAERLSPSQRVMLVARFTWGFGRAADPLPDGRTLVQRDLSASLGVSSNRVGEARQVLICGVPSLVEATWKGAVPIHTAYRVARGLDPADQDDYVKRVGQGSDPQRLAPPEPKKGSPPTGKRPRPSAATAHLPMLEHASRTLAAWAEHSFDQMAELDDSVAPAAAARLAAELELPLRALGRVRRLLEERSQG